MKGSIRTGIWKRIALIVLAIIINCGMLTYGLGNISTLTDAVTAALELDNVVLDAQREHYALSDALNSSVNCGTSLPASYDMDACVFNVWLSSAAADNVTHDGVNMLLDDIAPLHEELHGYSTDIVNFVNDKKVPEARSVFINKFHPKLIEVEGILNQVRTFTDEIVTEKQAKLDFAILIMVIGVIVAMLFVAAAVVLIIVYVMKNVVKPVQTITDASVKLSEGDLHIHIDVANKNDEIARLANSLNESVSTISAYIGDIGGVLEKVTDGDLSAELTQDFKGDFIALANSIKSITDSLNVVMADIQLTSEQVTLGAGQVSNGSQSMAQGATEQASAVQELAASISQISEQVQSNANSAEMANGMVQRVRADILTSNEKMNEMTRAMNDIRESSNEINRIIKTIDDIAFQTNILALNAAVEAARAGEAGKGFAVVADEVRNLASKSADAANETTELIDASIRAVENGARIVADTAKALTAVVGSAEEAADNVHNISLASEDQAVAVDQVTKGVDQISGVVQTNSATAEESAATSEELSGQARMLQELVGHFRLRGASKE